MSSKKNNNTIRIPTGHTEFQEDITQEQLKVLLNNELHGMVSNAGLDVPVEYMKPVEIPAQRINTDLDIAVKRNSTTVKKKISRKQKIAILLMLTIISVFINNTSRAFAVNNPAELVSIGDSCESVISRLGEPDLGSEDASYLKYYDIEYMGMNGEFELTTDTDSYVTSCSWKYSTDDKSNMDELFTAVYNDLSEVYGELGNNKSTSYTWNLDGYKVMLIDDYSDGIVINVY